MNGDDVDGALCLVDREISIILPLNVMQATADAGSKTRLESGVALHDAPKAGRNSSLRDKPLPKVGSSYPIY